MTYAAILKEARESWGGSEGEARAQAVKAVIDRVLTEYNALTTLPKPAILRALEKVRNVNVVNWYQDLNFPPLTEVEVFGDEDDFYAKYPSRTFQCPAQGLSPSS